MTDWQKNLQGLATRPRPGLAGTRAFTLLEVLVVVSIIALLIALLMPALHSVQGQAKMLNCASNLRNVALRFHLFAENSAAGGQGESEALGASRFRINDFQDSLYRLDEFWDLGAKSAGRLESRKEAMLCPAGPAALTKRKGYPCGRRSIVPLEDVTMAVNMRLYRSVVEVGGASMLSPVNLTYVRADVLTHPSVPLLIDVDAGAAVARGLEPFYIAPPGKDAGNPYSGGRYWAPSDRHGGRTNVAFVGGHVLSSADPGAERWNWDYTASIGN